MNSSQSSKKPPRVSIALPVYNGQNYLQAALDSLLAQSFEDFEIIIGDNASTDNTRGICEAYAQQDSRIRYIRRETNIGASANFSQLFEYAAGDYFKWAAHDDVCSPNFLKSCVEKMDSDSSVVLCCGKEIAIDSNGDVIENYMDKYHKLEHLESSLAYRRFHDVACRNHACYMVFGLIRTSALHMTPETKTGNYIGQDRVLLAELALIGPFWVSPETIYFRRHSEQYCALKSDSERTAWYNPNTGRDFAFTDSINFIEYVRAIRRQSKWPGRLLCYLVMVDWLRKMRHLLLKELTVAIRQRFQSSYG